MTSNELTYPFILGILRNILGLNSKWELHIKISPPSPPTEWGENILFVAIPGSPLGPNDAVYLPGPYKCFKD